MSNLKLVPELICEDIEVTKRFYVDIFGFTLKYERANEKFAYFSLNGIDIMVSGIEGMNRWIIGEMNRPFGRGIHFQWEVVDLEALYFQVKTKAPDSIFLEMETKDYLCGNEVAVQKQFVAQDPDGYLFRFCCDVIA